MIKFALIAREAQKPDREAEYHRKYNEVRDQLIRANDENDRLRQVHSEQYSIMVNKNQELFQENAQVNGLLIRIRAENTAPHGYSSWQELAARERDRSNRLTHDVFERIAITARACEPGDRGPILHSLLQDLATILVKATDTPTEPSAPESV